MKRAAREDPKCPSTGSAADFLPRKIELPALSEAAAKCHGCGLYCNATQTVFGEGPTTAIVMFVGEQPGDQEDRAGKPFVGPSGKVLDAALQEAGIPREKAYVTNAVKHFKWEPRGQRRIHSKSSSREIAACRPWLEAEIQVVRPRMIVCLGATAAQSLLGSSFRLIQHRGEVIKDSKWAPNILATVHPSNILRLPDHDAREAARRAFVEDISIVAQHLRSKPRKKYGNHMCRVRAV